ncbi:MAG: hypothetical protein IJX22_05090, partial [Opitutales bacterium]|nr:hypothetical protein [Opitutales bacterium]
KIVSLIDSCRKTKTDRSRLEEEIARYLGCDQDQLPETARKIASQSDLQQMAKEKYHHHILLRYLVSGHAPTEITSAYEIVHEGWNHGEEFHPWELIEFYRAVLFDYPEGFHRAIDICKKNSTTLRIIGHAITGAASPRSFKNLIEQDEGRLSVLKKILPVKAYSAILGWLSLENPEPPMEERLKFFASVLPFNFR